MNKEDFISHLVSELNLGKNVNFEYQFNDIGYKVSFLAPNENEDINIPSILIVPQIQNLNNQIVIESNNLESENLQEIIEQGIQTGIKLVKLTSVLPGPIVIPLIPSKVNYTTYSNYLENVLIFLVMTSIIELMILDNRLQCMI